VNTNLTAAFKYARHFLKASNGKGHGTHSPYIFHFIRDVLNDKKEYPEYAVVENLRRGLLADHSMITVQDLGAGSLAISNEKREISSVARHSAKPARLGQLLFRMVRTMNPRHVIELGTSLGITTSYLALGSKGSQVHTLEGAASLAEIAEKNFKKLGLSNIELYRGDFDDIFGPLASRIGPIDFLFIDGNHRLDPTISYFESALPAIHNDTVIIFDDIHWSVEMETAWQRIKENEKVTCSVDLFWMGLVFFRREFHEKQHFLIRF
jgi:predicted O-methyltransferase YrrM